jgi:hypothetical protein
MPGTSDTWRGDALLRAVRNHMRARNREAAGVLATAYRRRLSTPGPAPSRPGESPHKQSGDGVRSVRVRMAGDDIEVEAVWYLAEMDDGFGRIAARPWIDEGLNEARPAMERIVSRRLPGG